MKKILIFLTVMFLGLGCSKSKQERIKLYIIKNDSLNKVEDYSYKILEKNNFFLYDYKNDENFEKDFHLKYFPERNVLVWDSEEFIVLEKEKYFNEKISNLGFDVFIEREVKTHMNKIFFNKKYGVLRISNMWNPALIFLKDKKQVDNNLIIEILKK